MINERTYRKYTKPSELDKAVNTLFGLIKGIKADAKIKPAEISELANWCVLHQQLSDRHPFSEILPVVQNALSDGILTEEECEDVLWVCENTFHESPYYDLITSSMQILHGILHGVLADGILNDTEIRKLAQWIEESCFLAGTYPYDEINSLLTAALSDGVISDDERNMLIAYFGNFVDTTSSYNINLEELSKLRSQYTVDGICSICPEITVKDKHFCFTGESRKLTRSQFEDYILSLGGQFDKTPTLKTDYLIVGNAGNPCWAFACYGRKVEKAVSMRKKGGKILIVNEFDFWDAVQDINV